MNYKLIGKNNFTKPIDTILENRGIQDIKKFFKLSDEHIIHYSKLVNINKAVEKIVKHIEKGGELFVQVDSDPQMGIQVLHY
ncbi:hypothetical protein LCM23_13085 [Cytobacillus kochii]|uniref:hypothetical protein n=1 Tax=Cytobacillus kochii TaxID=859143 RepID=UPI001CD26683|nr:hypothetical protein [Cytobacillus kochii]MCA1027029.1 hypothetical protein [Cytobacillus kochii]